MDIGMEKKIAKAFVYPNKQERFLFELSKKCKDNSSRFPETRLHAICQLERIIDRRFSFMESMKFPEPQEIIKIMNGYGVKNNCYVLSEYEDYDGVFVDLNKAVEKLRWNGYSSLIVGLPSGFSHFKGESYASRQPNFFLKPKNRFDGLPWGN